MKPNFRNIWFVGGGEVSAECLRLRLADEVRYSIVPILIGNGISFFQVSTKTSLHLLVAAWWRFATRCGSRLLGSHRATDIAEVAYNDS
jgi:dihydrofolate reductase